MKTTIIELLGMIKDNKAPKKIIFKNEVYTFDCEERDYITTNGDGLFDVYVITYILNEEVEILETTITYKPDKIKKLSILTFSDLMDMPKEELVDVIKEQRFKINEIIDYIQKEI